MSVEQGKNLSPRQESNPWPPISSDTGRALQPLNKGETQGYLGHLPGSYVTRVLQAAIGSAILKASCVQ